MKDQVFNLLENTFSFVVGSFFSQNPVEYLKQHTVFNEQDKINVCTTAMRSVAIVQKGERNPEIKIHEKSVLGEAVEFWFHGYDFAENLEPFIIKMEIDNKEHLMTVSYNKETHWFSVYGEYLNTTWKQSLEKNLLVA